MQYGLGIDLGTTQTAAAVLVDGRVEVARLGGRRAEIPSLVFVKPDGGLLIGEAAERRGQTEPGRLAREFKRRVGDPVPILVGGVPFSAHSLTAKLLRHVLDTVAQFQGGPAAAVTLTHPANWGPYKREQLDQAIRQADAGPVLLRSEPEAAALQHATSRRIAPGESVAVYDLGGGTFDVAVLRRDGDGFVLLGEPEGIEQLGGIDFDEAVFGHVIQVLGSMAEDLDPNDPETMAALARLRRDCVEAKESLSFDTETMIPVALPGLHTRVRLNRSELESMIAPSLADTITATQRALRSAGVAPAELSAILLAGGSSRIPLVAQLLSTEFERQVIADPHPEHSIAMGAAVATAAALGGGSPFSAAIPSPRVPGTDAARAGGAYPGAAPPVNGAPAIGPGYAGASAGYSPTATPGGHPTSGSPGGDAPGHSQAATPSGAPTSGNPWTTTPSGAPGYSPATTPGGAPAGGYPSTTTPGGAPGYSPAATPGGAPAGGYPSTTTPGGAPGYSPTATPGGTPASGYSSSTALGGGSAPGYSPAATPPRGGNDAPASGGPATTYGTAVTPVSGGASPVSPAPAITQPIAYSRGAAVVPGTPPRQGSGLPDGPLPSYGPPTGGVPFPPAAPSSGGRRRNTRVLVMVGSLVVALLAGGTAVALAVTNDKKTNKTGGALSASHAPSTPVSASAAQAEPPMPTDTMLVRVDTGTGPPTRHSKVYTFTPGIAARVMVAGTKAGDILPKWSHDRTQIALTHNELDGDSQVYVMNKDGSNRRRLLDNVTAGRVAWSIDDQKLAYVKAVNKINQIFIIPVAGGTPVQLTHAPEQKDDPIWSADGKSIIYWVKLNGIKQIYEVNIADPVEPGRQITGPAVGAANDPAVSPDGTRILFTHEIDNATTSDIWIVNTDGSNPHRITSNPAREMDPTWSPDGTWFAFVRGDYSTPTVIAERPDGTGEITLTRPGAREGHPCWF